MNLIPVLYLSYDGMTDPLGQSQVIPYLQGLSQHGYKVSLISFEKAEKAGRKAHIQQLMHNAGIDWHPLPYTKFPPVVSTLKDIRAMKRLAFQLHQKLGFKIVHCRSYIAALVGLEMKHKAGTKFIFDMRGFWADERIDGNIWSLDNAIYRWVYNYFKRKEIDFLSDADYTISLTHNAKKEIHSWQALQKEEVPIEVIPCCVDTVLFSAENFPAKGEVRKALGLPPEALVLNYLGSIGTWYMLTEMLLFFKQLKAQKPEAIFFLMTGDNPEGILSEAQQLGISPKDIVIKQASREDVPKFLKAVDVSIFFIKPVFSKKASSPTKQGEIMSMGIPVICNTSVGDTDYVVEEYRSGVLVNDLNGSFSEAASTVEQALSLNPEQMRAGAMAFYSLEEGVKRYAKVYKEVLG